MNIELSASSVATFGAMTAPLFQIAHNETLVAASVGEVWDFLTDTRFETLKAWNPEVMEVRHLAGEARKEKELLLVTKDPSAKQSPFYMLTLRMIPNRQRVLRVEATDCSFMAFVDHSLHELGERRTKLVYNGYIETFRTPAERVRSFDYKADEDAMVAYLKKGGGLLKRIVEERASR